MGKDTNSMTAKMANAPIRPGGQPVTAEFLMSSTGLDRTDYLRELGNRLVDIREEAEKMRSGTNKEKAREELSAFLRSTEPQLEKIQLADTDSYSLLNQLNFGTRSQRSYDAAVKQIDKLMVEQTERVSDRQAELRKIRIRYGLKQ